MDGYRRIKTDVGYIANARDAIFLDSLYQKANKFTFKGRLNPTFCEDGEKGEPQIPFELTTVGVVECTAIDEDNFYRITRIDTESSFLEEVNDNDAKYKVLIFQTYDWSYIIKCKDYSFITFVNNNTEISTGAL